MSCRNYEYKLDELRWCGCRRCEEEYYNMRGGYERNYRSRDYYLPPIAMISAILPAAVPEEPKMEEPKNIAIKVLVEKLKAEQACLASSSASLKSYEDSAKTYRTAKNKNLHAIKELASALKKLGHKEA